MHSTNRVFLLALSSTALWLSLGGSTVAAQDRGAAPIIDSIAFISRNVFDPDEARSNLLFRIMNGFHIRTRRYVVGQELLFREGESYDSIRIDETARNLRALGLFRDISIDTVRVQGRLVVRVDAADAWTTTAQIDGRATGGDFMWGLGIKEKNILGTGTLFRTKYRHEVDRNSFTLEAAQSRLLGTRVEAYGRWDKLSDGEFGEWRFGAPYRASVDRNAFILEGEYALRRALQFQDGALAREFWRRLFRQRAFASIAPIANEGGYVRIGAVGQIKREEYLDFAQRRAVVPDTVSGVVGMAFEGVKSRFKVTHYYLAFARDVDVDLSHRLAITTWIAPDAFGYDRNGIGPSVSAQTALAAGNHFARIEAHANGLFTSNGLDSGQVRGVLTAVSQIIPRTSFVLRVEAGIQEGIAPGGEFDLGFDRGLRRFSSHSFTGDREMWANLEHRIFLVDEFLHLFGLGLATFVDYGTAWFEGQTREFGGAVGLGARLSSTRAGAVTMGRIDFAYRFGKRYGDKRLVFSFGRNVTF